MKKALALILCLVMLLGVFPMNATFAEDETKKTVSESGKEETVEISKEDEESSKEPEEVPAPEFGSAVLDEDSEETPGADDMSRLEEQPPIDGGYWPSVSEDNYCVFTAYRRITTARDDGHIGHIGVGDVCYIYSFGSTSCRVKYSVDQDWVTATVSTTDLFTSLPNQGKPENLVKLNKETINTYSKWSLITSNSDTDGHFSKQSIMVYVCGHQDFGNSRYVWIVYPTTSKAHPKQAYKLAWISYADYSNKLKGKLISAPSATPLPPVSSEGWPSLSQNGFCLFTAETSISTYSSIPTDQSNPYGRIPANTSGCKVYEINQTYCRVNYSPESGPRETQYVKTSDLFNGLIKPIEKKTATNATASKDCYTYWTLFAAHKGTTCGYFVPDDTIYKFETVTQDGVSYTRVMYTSESGDRAYKLAWTKSADYIRATNPAFKTITITVKGSTSVDKLYTGSEQTYTGNLNLECDDPDIPVNLLFFRYSGNKTVTGTDIGTHITRIDTDKCHYNDPNYPNVTVTFKADEDKPFRMTIIPDPDRKPFQDVWDSKKYYYDSVNWAKDNGLASGTDPQGYYFKPNNKITRAQVVTFIWALMGRDPANIPANVPEDQSPFTDVKKKSDGTKPYYYDAVLWAYYNTPQVLIDDTAEAFEPNSECSRGEAILLLWKAMGQPEPERTINPFVDVSEYAPYYTAVLWAYHHFPQRIASGTTDSEFSPDSKVTRAQFVTFMYRLTDNGTDELPKDAENVIYSESGDYNPVDWPALSESAYYDFYAPSSIPVYESDSSDEAVDFLVENSRCLAYSFSERIYVYYINKLGSPKYGYINRTDLIKADTPYAYQTNDTYNAFKTQKGGFCCQIKENSTIYGLPFDGNDSNYVQVIFPYSYYSDPNLAYRLGWISKTDYESIKRPYVLQPGDANWVCYDTIEDLLASYTNGHPMLYWIGEAFTPDCPLPEKVSSNGKTYYMFPMAEVSPDQSEFEERPEYACIEASLLRQCNDACFPKKIVNDELQQQNPGQLTGDNYQKYIFTKWKAVEQTSDGTNEYITLEFRTYFLIVINTFVQPSNNELECIFKIDKAYEIVTRCKFLFDGTNICFDDVRDEKIIAVSKIKDANITDDDIENIGVLLYPAYDVQVEKIGRKPYDDEVDAYGNFTDINHDHDKDAYYYTTDDLPVYDANGDGEENDVDDAYIEDLELAEIKLIDHLYLKSYQIFANYSENVIDAVSIKLKDYYDFSTAFNKAGKHIFKLVKRACSDGFVEAALEEGVSGIIALVGEVWGVIEKGNKIRSKKTEDEVSVDVQFCFDAVTVSSDYMTWNDSNEAIDSNTHYTYQFKAQSLVGISNKAGVVVFHFNFTQPIYGRLTISTCHAIATPAPDENNTWFYSGSY